MECHAIASGGSVSCAWTDTPFKDCSSVFQLSRVVVSFSAMPFWQWFV